MRTRTLNLTIAILVLALVVATFTLALLRGKEVPSDGQTRDHGEHAHHDSSPHHH